MFPIPMLMGSSAGSPCDGMPTISSVGTPSVQQAGDCSLQNLVVRTRLTLSGSLPGTGSPKVQFRSYFGLSSSPSFGSWQDWGSFSGSVSDLDNDLGFYTTNQLSAPGGASSSTYYYAVQFRLIGTDGSTECDGPDQSTTLTLTVYDCFI